MISNVKLNVKILVSDNLLKSFKCSLKNILNQQCLTNLNELKNIFAFGLIP